jgi:hypothetical protein
MMGSETPVYMINHEEGENGCFSLIRSRKEGPYFVFNHLLEADIAANNGTSGQQR